MVQNIEFDASNEDHGKLQREKFFKAVREAMVEYDIVIPIYDFDVLASIKNRADSKSVAE